MVSEAVSCTREAPPESRKRRTKRRPQRIKQVGQSERLQKELQQARHLLGESLKLRSQSAQWSVFRICTPGICEEESCTFLVHVPHDYPCSALRVEPEGRGSGAQSRVAAHFNWRCKQQCTRDAPLAAQLNYLISERQLLATPDYVARERLRKSFYALFAAPTSGCGGVDGER
ncbi:AGL362Wp [Eremothecium gossypii ATCC 10895]|uniref:AGL362Wp n=1 Tax=Eremothecium gossypii (strain ATCC 10895 / CBS 109.51 / FGSC 9923 / NRRL Y-1056) TaxID=284811 RepID=Q751Q1_EREGS|nr:AGL362Wp [Eremothecium gossypii ATCC 10895]AAS54129.1 AGL362Wp [Eremothecium gossypii ATCC 10895]AEY98455.1 FAGL362Wp [Eremothecium gossypii FDAG1]